MVYKAEQNTGKLLGTYWKDLTSEQCLASVKLSNYVR